MIKVDEHSIEIQGTLLDVLVDFGVITKCVFDFIVEEVKMPRVLAVPLLSKNVEFATSNAFIEREAQRKRMREVQVILEKMREDITNESNA